MTRRELLLLGLVLLTLLLSAWYRPARASSLIVYDFGSVCVFEGSSGIWGIAKKDLGLGACPSGYR